jgi:hypothetical protein
MIRIAFDYVNGSEGGPRYRSLEEYEGLQPQCCRMGPISNPTPESRPSSTYGLWGEKVHPVTIRYIPKTLTMDEFADPVVWYGQLHITECGTLLPLGWD